MGMFQIKLVDSVRKVYGSGPAAAHDTLISWGQTIKRDFDSANASYNLRHGQPSSDAVATALQTWGQMFRTALNAQGKELADQRKLIHEQTEQIKSLQHQFVEQGKMLRDMHKMLQTMMQAGPSASFMVRLCACVPLYPASRRMPALARPLHVKSEQKFTSSLGCNCTQDPAAGTRATRTASQVGPSPAKTQPRKDDTGEGPASTNIDDRAPQRQDSRATTAVQGQGALAMLMPQRQDIAPGLNEHRGAVYVFRFWLRNKWSRSEDATMWQNKQHREKGAHIYRWFQAIATAEEIQALKGSDEGLVEKAYFNLQVKMRRLLKHLYDYYEVKKPQGHWNKPEGNDTWKKLFPLSVTSSYNVVTEIKSKLTLKLSKCQSPDQLVRGPADFEANNARSPHPDRVQASIGVGQTRLHVLASTEAPAAAGGNRQDKSKSPPTKKRKA